jgi:uncharacterized membrane protein
MNTVTLHRLAIVVYLALMALLMLRFTWLAPPPRSLISVSLLLFAGPLLIPLRGLLRGRRYTIAWSTLLILAYFIHGTATAAEGGMGFWLGLAEISLSLGYFFLAILYIRSTRNIGATESLRHRSP